MISEVLYGAFAEVVWFAVGGVVAALGIFAGMSTQHRNRGGGGGGMNLFVAIPGGAAASAIAAAYLLLNGLSMSDRLSQMAIVNAVIFGISACLGAK